MIEAAQRRGKALSLLWEDVWLERRFILLRKGNDQKARQVPLLTAAVSLLQALPRSADGLHIFPITGNVVKLSMRDALNGAGLTGSGICTHTFRHEACSRLGDLGFTPIQIAAVSGHKSLQLLARYTHVNVRAIGEKLG